MSQYLDPGAGVQHDVFDGALDVLRPWHQPGHLVVVTDLLPPGARWRLGVLRVPVRAKKSIYRILPLLRRTGATVCRTTRLTCCSWWWCLEVWCGAWACPSWGGLRGHGTDPEARCGSWRCARGGCPLCRSRTPAGCARCPLWFSVGGDGPASKVVPHVGGWGVGGATAKMLPDQPEHTSHVSKIVYRRVKAIFVTFWQSTLACFLWWCDKHKTKNSWKTSTSETHFGCKFAFPGLLSRKIIFLCNYLKTKICLHPYPIIGRHFHRTVSWSSDYKCFHDTFAICYIWIRVKILSAVFERLFQVQLFPSPVVLPHLGFAQSLGSWKQSYYLPVCTSSSENLFLWAPSQEVQEVSSWPDARAVSAGSSWWGWSTSTATRRTKVILATCFRDPSVLLDPSRPSDTELLCFRKI